jgi:hypothetical protein
VWGAAAGKLLSATDVWFEKGETLGFVLEKVSPPAIIGNGVVELLGIEFTVVLL